MCMVDDNLVINLKNFKKFDNSQSQRGENFLIDWLVVELFYVFNYFKLSLLGSYFFHVILKLHFFFFRQITLPIWFLKEDFFLIDFKGLADKVVAVVSGEKRPKNNLSVDRSDGDCVIAEKIHRSALNFLDVLARNFDEGITEKDVFGIEFRVEADSVRSDENSAS